MEAQPCRTDGSISPRLFNTMAIVKKYAKELYAKEVVMKAAYMFTDCAYLHLDVDTENYLISMQSKTNESEETLLNRFENELIVQQARYMVTKDTKNIREMIVARALSSTIVNLVKEEEVPQNKYNANDILTDWYDANEE